MRTIAYIDGFNLYYRAVRSYGCKWLDIWLLIQQSLPANCHLVKVKYFTALVNPLPGSEEAPGRQRVYLAALRKYRPDIEIILGEFAVHAKCQRMLHPDGDLARREVTGRRKGGFVAKINHDVLASYPDWHDDPGPSVHVINTEEKGSDVNLAVHFLNDAWADKADCLALVSNDSDLSEAARLVRDELGKHVLLLTPEKVRPSLALSGLVSAKRVIRRDTFGLSLLPELIPDTNIRKPDTW